MHLDPMQLAHNHNSFLEETIKKHNSIIKKHNKIYCCSLYVKAKKDCDSAARGRQKNALARSTTVNQLC